MKLTVLGSGNGSFEVDRQPPSFLVEEGSTRILLDCGYGTFHTLAHHKRMGKQCAPLDLTGVCISHFHGDHMADLLPIINTRVLMEGNFHTPLTVIGPLGLKQRWLDLHHIYCCNELLREEVLIQECGGGHEFVIGGHDMKDHAAQSLCIQPFQVDHIAGEICLGFRVTCRKTGKTLVYTGDLNRDQTERSNLNMMRHANLLIVDAGAAHSGNTRHFTAQAAWTLGRSCEVEQIILNHISSRRIEEVQAQICHHSDINNVRIATDGMEIEI